MPFGSALRSVTLNRELPAVSAMEPVITERIAARLREAGVAFTIHRHPAARTVEEALAGLPFPFDGFLKTIALPVKDGPLVLAALRGADRLDYRAVAAALGVRRAEVRTLSAAEVEELLGVAPGGVGPLLPDAGARVLIDPAGLALTVAFCGAGHPERTLEISPAELQRLTGAVVAPLTG